MITRNRYSSLNRYRAYVMGQEVMVEQFKNTIRREKSDKTQVANVHV